MKGYERLLVAGLVLAFALTPTGAYAAGTGDDLSDVKARPTTEDRAVEKEYRAWTAQKEAGTSDGISAAVIPDAPYQYFYTPTHAQERGYWCGPATTQIIDDYWGTTISQSEIARLLGTTTDGTWFPSIAPVLRQLTGVSYVVSARVATSGDVYSRVQYGLLNRRHPAAADVRIKGTVWDNYVYDHDGHIIPIEAFDWRFMTIRINDPYNEATSRAGGGQTLGHKTYPAWQVADGVLRHPQKVLIY